MIMKQQHLHSIINLLGQKNKYFIKGQFEVYSFSVIMEHASGHIKGGIGSYFNILGLDWHFLYPR